MKETIPVFYDARQVSQPASFSPSAAKPRWVVERWQEMPFPISVVAPQPLAEAQLWLAHDPEYVRGILDGRIANGFGSKDPAIAASLPWTTGSMLSAARCALASGRVAVSPTSGFHHARYNRGGGFCTFNGLMTTVLSLVAAGEVQKVAILDCDQHFGDGTEDIINTLGVRDIVRHVTAGLGYPRNPAAFLAGLPSIIAGFLDCNLILYQAGTDPHVDDPLGGWLTTDQLFERDRRVFACARRYGIPIAWNLAGGYQDPFDEVLEIHDNTLRACATAFLGDDSWR